VAVPEFVREVIAVTSTPADGKPPLLAVTPPLTSAVCSEAGLARMPAKRLECNAQAALAGDGAAVMETRMVTVMTTGDGIPEGMLSSTDATGKADALANTFRIKSFAWLE
jgi:hypothetical protein